MKSTLYILKLYLSLNADQYEFWYFIEIKLYVEIYINMNKI